MCCHDTMTAMIDSFVKHVLDAGSRHYRDFAWRSTCDPYAILLSEVMLQQTQVVRVIGYYDAWLERFPSLDALAAADTAEVLAAWQGLGYNRRALALKRLALEVSEQKQGVLPANYEELQKLPGIGPATAAGVMVFAHNCFAPYLETNVRSVVLHELFADKDEVCDKEIMAIVEQAVKYLEAQSCKAGQPLADARTWNYALLDYGAWLKKAFPNPSRRSKHHTRQSRFEGSFRQKRAALLREILNGAPQNAPELAESCKLGLADTERALDALLKEGFIQRSSEGKYFIAQ